MSFVCYIYRKILLLIKDNISLIWYIILWYIINYRFLFHLQIHKNSERVCLGFQKNSLKKLGSHKRTKFYDKYFVVNNLY